MPLPQDIRPVFQDIQDTLVTSDAPWIEQSPTAKMKVLWVGRETGTFALLITDSIYGWKLLHGGYNTGGVLDAGWALFYALLGASALHPSMRSLSEPAPDQEVRLTRPRLALLAGATRRRGRARSR